ncbi:MAG: isopeptide-forming domain-containing fimbrial protein [Blautia sp.]|nr:isopeptide-forming domain-containing fimbrial protein [Blautia sp.]
MKRFLKIKERMGAFWLALLFAMQTILGILPPQTVMAQVNAIELWKEEQIIDYEHRFNMKFQPGITTIESFGCDNLDREAFINHGRSDRDAETVRITDKFVPGSAGMRYNNVGRDGAGNIVDVRLTLLEVKNAQDRYDLQSPAATDETRAKTYAWENNEAHPIVGFSRNSIGVYIYSLGSAKVNFQFLKHGTQEPLVICGHGTIRDIDASQGVSIPPDSGLERAYIIEGNDFLTVDGTSVEAQNSSITPDDEEGWLNTLYQTDHFNLVFSHQKKLDSWDEYREKNIAKAGSQENWAQKIKEKYVDSSGNTLCPTFKGQKCVMSHAYFDFTSYCFGGIEMKKEPEKKVGESGCTWDQAVASEKENPFEIRGTEEFQYMVQTEVTPNKLKSFVVQDTLEDCLTIDDISKITVVNDSGQDVTELFDMHIEGQTITLNAKENTLKQESFTDNQVYTFILKVHRKAESEIDIPKYLSEDGYSIVVPNHAEMRYERLNGTGGSMQTGTVWVRGLISPELEVKKNSSRYEWAVGDTVDYKVTVSQIKPYIKAVNVHIEDQIPSGLKLLDGHYTVETSPGGDNCNFTPEGENGWKAECPSLKAGETITVYFQCEALEASNGQEWDNIVTATSDNFVDPVSKEQQYRKDIAEVWPNSPQLEIDKTADHYEWQVGDEVSYRVTVNNTVPGTIAKDVKITDLGLPEGLVLAGGGQNIEILNLLQQVDYPVPDKKTGQAFETRPVESYVEADGTGFSFYCSYLPYSYPVTLLFHCTAQDAANGHESVNAATVSAGNAPEKSDDAEIYVNSGQFRIEKTADHYEWRLGEQVQYTVVVENMNPGTIARNVTVWDTQMPQGLALASADSVSLSGIPQSIVEPVAGSADVPGVLNPEFYNETQEKLVGYEFLPEGTGWRLNISDLPAGTPVTISFLCTVTEEINGMESINIANVQAQNTPEKNDDAEAYVNTAVLDIHKSFQNPYLQTGDGRTDNEFRVGEQIYYQVVVNNLQKGSIARNVTITDMSLPDGLALDEGEDALTVSGIPVSIQEPVAGTDDAGNMLNPENYNQTREKPVTYQVMRQGNGWSLIISDLPYQTPVTIIYRCIPKASVNGQEIVNTVQAGADNAAAVKACAKVWINSPVLKVVKETEKSFYKYGDIITYRVKITQEQTGCVARNVTLSDIIDTPGVTLQKDSIVLMDDTGTVVEAGLDVKDDNSFLVSTGRNLVEDSNYSIFDLSRGGLTEQVTYNPVDFRNQKYMVVEYQAAVTDKNLAGKTVHNTATADSQEKIPVSSETETEIHSPVLEIVKECDRKEYESGDTGYYKLTVRQLREDVTDDNIVIEDALQTFGGILKKDSIFVMKNGEEIKNAAVEASDTGFIISTGTGLSDKDKLEVCYEVKFDTQEKGSAQVINIAKAHGDRATEVTAQQEVKVNKKPDPTATPTPSVSPIPKPTHSPSASPSSTPTVQNTPIPSRIPSGGFNSMSSGSSGKSSTGSGSSGYSSSGGYNSGYGYQGGSLTGSAKTGDTRPFKTMAVIGIIGAIFLGCGIFIYKHSGKRGRK